MFINRTILSQTSVPVSAKGLDAYMLRGRAQANNLANVTTPGYKRIEVTFEDQLKQALDQKKLQGERTNQTHMYLGKPELDKIKANAFRSNDQTLAGEINNVDIDIEMAKLAENQIQYEFAVKFIQGRMSDISSAIKMRGLGG